MGTEVSSGDQSPKRAAFDQLVANDRFPRVLKSEVLSGSQLTQGPVEREIQTKLARNEASPRAILFETSDNMGSRHPEQSASGIEKEG